MSTTTLVSPTLTTIEEATWEHMGVGEKAMLKRLFDGKSMRFIHLVEASNTFTARTYYDALTALEARELIVTPRVNGRRDIRVTKLTLSGERVAAVGVQS